MSEQPRKSGMLEYMNWALERLLVTMQAAVIAGRSDPAKGLRWIENTLDGPGLLPNLDETDAQAYYGREAPKYEDMPSLATCPPVALASSPSQPCAAQQAPQERADEPLKLFRLAQDWADESWRDGRHLDHDGTSDKCSAAEVKFKAALALALAANPQQSNGAVEKPTKEPDAAIGASQVPEGVANAERSAMQLCPTHDPQQIASETKENET